MGKSETPSTTLRWLYLCSYNWVLFCGWVYILYLAVRELFLGKPQAVYAAVERPLQIFQTAALFEASGQALGGACMQWDKVFMAKLERANFIPNVAKHPTDHCCGLIFNSVVGIVRSPVTATVPQISSRLYVVWGILYSFPEVRDHWLVSSLVLSWGTTEVVRYLFFGLKEAFGYTPGFLLWVRYSTFLVLYPTGILSETGLVYLALPLMKASGLYSIRMPNQFNYGFDYRYASILGLAAYIPGSPYLYGYMIGQRKKALGKTGKQKST